MGISKAIFRVFLGMYYDIDDNMIVMNEDNWRISKANVILDLHDQFS
jgi:hypothetical protein